MSGSSPTSEIDGGDSRDSRRLILVVDDEPSVRAMVLASIRVHAMRYRVIGAGNATEAVAQAKDQQPDLVLLDVALPGPSGFSAGRSLKTGTCQARIPVCLLKPC